MANRYYSATTGINESWYSGGSQNIYLELHIYTIATDVANNTTTERADLYMVVNDASSQWFNLYGSYAFVGINGHNTEPDYDKVPFDARSTGVKNLITSWDTVVTHNDDGTKGIGISAHHYTNIGLGNASIPPDIYECDTIPRYPNVNQSVASRTVNSITMNWSSDNTVDYVWYSIDNGTNWVSVGGTNAKSGSYTITDLSPNTNYKIKTRLRRKDSQLTKDSSAISQTTYQIAKFTQTSNFTIGSSTTVKYNNPSNATIAVGIYTDATSPSAIASYRSATGSAYTFNFTSAEINSMYALIPNSTSTTVRYYIRTTVNSTNYYDYVVRTIYLNSNASRPTFSDFSYTEANDAVYALTGSRSKIIKYYSKLKISVSTSNKMVAKNGASPASYTFIVGSASDSKSYSSSSEVYAEFTGDRLQATSMRVDAVDSRGLSTTVSKTIPSSNVVNYTKPVFATSNSILRQGAVGTTANLDLKVTYWNGNFGNTTNDLTTIQYKVIEMSNSDWDSVEWTPLPSSMYSKDNGVLQTNSEAIISEFLNTGTEYQAKFQVIDKLDTVEQIIFISAGDPLVILDKTRKIVSIGKVPSQIINQNAVDVLGRVYQNDGEPVYSGPESLFNISSGGTDRIFFPDEAKIMLLAVYAYDTVDNSSTYILYSVFQKSNDIDARPIVVSGSNILVTFDTQGTHSYAEIANNSSGHTLECQTNIITIISHI